MLPAIEKAKKGDAAYEEEFGEHKNVLSDISSGKSVGGSVEYRMTLTVGD